MWEFLTLKSTQGAGPPLSLFFPSKMRGTLLPAPFSFLYHLALFLQSLNSVQRKVQLCIILPVVSNSSVWSPSEPLILFDQKAYWNFFPQIKRAASSLKWELPLPLDKKMACGSLDYCLHKIEKSPMEWHQQDRSWSLFQWKKSRDRPSRAGLAAPRSSETVASTVLLLCPGDHLLAAGRNKQKGVKKSLPLFFFFENFPEVLGYPVLTSPCPKIVATSRHR